MVRLHRCLGERFASLTCSKLIELFSKHDFMITRKTGALSASIAAPKVLQHKSNYKKSCSTKVLTQPSCQINRPTTLYMVEREVEVYGYVRNPTGITAVKSVSLLFENGCRTIVPMLVPGIKSRFNSSITCIHCGQMNSHGCNICNTKSNTHGNLSFPNDPQFLQEKTFPLE